MQCRYLVVEISPLSSSFWVITMYPWSLFSIFKLRVRQARGILTPCYIYNFESKIMPSLYTLIVYSHTVPTSPSSVYSCIVTKNLKHLKNIPAWRASSLAEQSAVVSVLFCRLPISSTPRAVGCQCRVLDGLRHVYWKYQSMKRYNAIKRSRWLNYSNFLGYVVAHFKDILFFF